MPRPSLVGSEYQAGRSLVIQAYNATQGIRQMAGHNFASGSEAIRESVGSVARSQERLVDVLAGVQKDMAAVQRDVAVVQRDLAVIQKDVSGLHADMAGG